MAYSGSVVSVGFYFQDQPALASGVVVAGTGIGIITFPLLAQSLIDHYDLDGALLLLGAVTFQASVFGALIRPHPLEIERQCVTSKSVFKTITDHIVIIKNPSFVYLCLSILAWSMAVNISVMFLPEYFISTGSTSYQAAIFISVFGFGNMISRILIGFASQSIDGKLLYFGSYGILSLLTFLLPLYGIHDGGRVLYCLALGLYSGGVWSLLSPLAAELVGLFHLATAFGIELFVVGVGFLVGPYVGGKTKQ